MKKIISILCCCASVICMSSCKENYSNGEKVGNLIEFTKKGVFWDSWSVPMSATREPKRTKDATHERRGSRFIFGKATPLSKKSATLK